MVGQTGYGASASFRDHSKIGRTDRPMPLALGAARVSVSKRDGGTSGVSKFRALNMYYIHIYLFKLPQLMPYGRRACWFPHAVLGIRTPRSYASRIFHYIYI